MRRRCAIIVDALEMPEPFNTRELADRVAAARGRPLELQARPMPPGVPGLWTDALRDRDVILYEANTSRLHQEHIQLHELGHVLCGHPPVPAVNMAALRKLLHNIDPEVVARCFARGPYTDEQEREAELVASLVLAGARRLRPTPEWEAPPETAGTRHRLALALEPPTDRD